MTLLGPDVEKPVLVVEDSPEEQRQIREALEKAGFTVSVSVSGEDEELYNYKALHRESQLVIVDLDLNFKSEPDPLQDYKLIRDKLWPADRATVFIVYSKHTAEDVTGLFGAVQPSMIMLKKRIKGTRLTEESLAELVTTAKEAYQVVRAGIEPARVDPFSHLADLRAVGLTPSAARAASYNVAIQSLELSLKRLQLMVELCAPFVHVGSVARHLGIIVYGSCGRLEMRPESDLEFSVVVDSGAKLLYPALSNVAVVLWNRVAKALEAVPVEYEGALAIDGNTHRLLTETQSDEDLPNSYRPVIGTGGVLVADLSKKPQLRNRHYQLLFEARSVFNPGLLFALKKRLIEDNVTQAVNDRWSILCSKYFESIQDQFVLDAVPRSVDSWKDVKRFCLRTGNILATRVGIAVSMTHQGVNVNSEAEWRELLEWLTLSGVLKLTRATREFKGKGKARKHLIDVTDNYVSLMERFANTAAGAPSQEVLDGRANALKGHVHAFGNAVGELLAELRDVRELRVHAKNHAWVFEVSKVLDALR